LTRTYNVFKESQTLNEEVTVTAGEGLTQILQKMTGVNLSASQSVDNLKTAIEKVGNGNYEDGLDVVKKLFSNNGAGSIDQQADKLTDIINNGGKLGDAFSKSQGTFGGKGLFSIKLPPEATEKLINGVAKIANKASQAVDTIKQVGSSVKQAGSAVRQAVTDQGIDIQSLLTPLGIITAGVGIAGALYYNSKNKSRGAVLDKLLKDLKPVEVKPGEGIPNSDTTDHSKYQPQDGEGNTDGSSSNISTWDDISKEEKISPSAKLDKLAKYVSDEAGIPLAKVDHKKDAGDLIGIVITLKDGTEIKLPKDLGIWTDSKKGTAEIHMTAEHVKAAIEKAEKTTTSNVAKVAQANTPTTSDTSPSIELSPEDTSTQNTETPPSTETKKRKYTPAVTTALTKLGIPKEKWDEIPATGKTGNLLAKDIKDYITKNEKKPSTTDTNEPEAKATEPTTTTTGKEEKKEKTQPEDDETNKEELVYGKPLKYVPEYKKLVKPKESIKIPGTKNSEGELISKDLIILVTPEAKKSYTDQENKKVAPISSALKNLKAAIDKRVPLKHIIINLNSKDVTTEAQLIRAINSVKLSNISSEIKESLIIEHLKNLLFESLKEDVYTPTLNTTMPFEKGRNIDRRDLERELRNNTPSDNQDYNDNIAEDASIYNSRIDSERLSKINELIRQMGDEGIKMYNKYAEDNGCPPWNGKARIFNPVVVDDDNDRQYVDGEGKKRYVNEQTESNFVPEAQGFIQTINDIYKNCTSKTGLKPFTDHLKNNKFDVEKKQPKLIEAFIKYTLKTCKPEHKEELQQALEDIKAKYQK